MAQPVRDSFLDLERHRQLLENNVQKLRKSLEHWQIWEAEYEGLKQEIQAARPEPTFQQLITIGREYGGSLLTQDEVDDMLGVKNGKLRGAPQVTDLISKRMDYVQRNVKTLENQVQTAENKLAAATVVSTPDAMNEDELPLTEIFEELDDDGNVISSRVSTPGSSKAQLLEVLEKAGIKDLRDPEPAAPKDVSDRYEPVPAEPKVQKVVEETGAGITSQKTAKKGVTFSEDIKIATFKMGSRPNLRDTDYADTNETVTSPKGQTAVKGVLKDPQEAKSRSDDQAEHIKGIIEIVEEQNKPLPPDVVIPEDEPEEEAALRREMLRYGMSDLGEVGAIVAELNLEEDDSGFTDEDEDGDFDEDEDDDDDSSDAEDSYGRSTRKTVTDKMHRQMRELEERLNARMIENAGPNGAVGDGVGIVSVKADEEEQSPANGLEKGVRFSEKLDIASPPEATVSQGSQTGLERAVPFKSPIGDIIERVPAPSKETGIQVAAKKPSRFKSARAAETSAITPALKASSNSKPRQNPLQALPLMPVKSINSFSAPIPAGFAEKTRKRTLPTGPQNATIGDVVEHEPSADLNAGVRKPDELDQELLNQEVSVEYHRMRNRMIQLQGGFVQEDELEVDDDGFLRMPPTEEEGGPKKMSRFKAARISQAY